MAVCVWLWACVCLGGGGREGAWTACSRDPSGGGGLWGPVQQHDGCVSRQQDDARRRQVHVRPGWALHFVSRPLPATQTDTLSCPVVLCCAVPLSHTRIKDKAGRSPDDPQYNPRTLRIPGDFFKTNKVCFCVSVSGGEGGGTQVGEGSC